MPGNELLGNEELELIRAVFANGAVLVRHGFDDRRHGLYMVRDFEASFAHRVGSPYALAVSSATAGMKVALRALGIHPGDEIITQAFTHISTVEAIIEVGGRPVIVDVDETLNMDPIGLQAAITERTRAIMPVHMLGVPADMGEIMRIAHDAEIAVIEDAAEALGARIGGDEVGTLGRCGVYSLDYNKTITAGEGGMLVSADHDFIERARSYHDHGHAHDPVVPRGEDAPSGSGFNYRLSEVAAAIGLAQLRKLDHIVQTNTLHHAYLCDRLGPYPPARLRPVPAAAEPLNDCLVLQFSSGLEAQVVSRAIAVGGHRTKILPNALRWHFARYWPHILAPFGLDEEVLAQRTAQSNYHLGRSVAVSVELRQTQAQLDELAAVIREAW